MGKRKELTPQVAVEQWLEVTQRASLSGYRNVNGVIIGINPDRKLILMVPDPQLLNLLLAEDGENKLIAYDRDDPETEEYLPWFDYGLRLDEDGWLSLDGDEFREGATVTVQLAEDLPKSYLSKDSLPLKLKKAEFTEIAYRIFYQEKVLGLKKRFEAYPNHGFTVVKLYKII